jgi:iron(III) transport system ATP-binding protein
LYSHPADLTTARFLGDVVALDGTARGGEVTCALGTVPSAGVRPDGPCTVVLRPEQLVVERTGQPGAAGAGRVVAVEFQGSTESLSVALDQVPDRPVRIPVPGGSRFAPGDRVTVRPLGAAAVFPAT